MRYEEKQHLEIGYLVRYPNDYCEGKKYPVIIQIHGAGGRGLPLSESRNHAFFTITDKMQDFPFIVAAPICPGATDTWFDHFQSLKSLIIEVINSGYADAERIYLMGGSMGGYTVWELGMSMPERLAAIVPICGGGMYWNAGRLANVPVWAFHGALDKTVLPEESEKMVNAVNKRGGNARLTIYPENSHDAWSDTFSNPEVYKWLLSHKNENAKTLVNEYSKNLKDFG